VPYAKVIQALIRDDFRCVVTGIYFTRVDSVQYLNITEEEKRAAGGEVFTKCAHIVPDSTYFNVTVPSRKVCLFFGFLDLVTYPCTERLFCLSIGSLEAVRIRC
jgi:hypothetical protein